MPIKPPKISVCIPTYNQARYLRQALDSVLRQTLQDFEIIVYDDASTDDTQQVIAGVADARLRYFRQPYNVGEARNRNSCVAVARGQYIAWLDSDDLYHPDMLAVQSAVLDRHPNVGLAHGAYEVIDGEGRRLPDWPLPFKCNVIEPGKDAFRELILSNYVNGTTVMMHRDCYKRVGPYRWHMGRSSTDWEMWLRIALHADLGYTASTLAQYRQHSNSISAMTTLTDERLRCDIKLT
jgi:glycosyltransferase involved in cell wall biosynthesis